MITLILLYSLILILGAFLVIGFVGFLLWGICKIIEQKEAKLKKMDK